MIYSLSYHFCIHSSSDEELSDSSLTEGSSSSTSSNVSVVESSKISSNVDGAISPSNQVGLYFPPMRFHPLPFGGMIFGLNSIAFFHIEQTEFVLLICSIKTDLQGGRELPSIPLTLDNGFLFFGL